MALSHIASCIYSICKFDCSPCKTCKYCKFCTIKLITNYIWLICFVANHTKLQIFTFDVHRLDGKGLGINIEPSSNAQELASAAVQLKSLASDRLGFTSSKLLICIILFIATHALGSGTIIWVFVCEIFPAHFRAAGQSVGSFTHWIFAAVLTLVFQIFIANFDVGYMFAFFAFMMLLQLLWALFIMPEQLTDQG